MIVGVAAALVVGALVGPAALSGRLARSLGRYEAFALALCAPLVELALVFGLALLALGYPDDVRNGNARAREWSSYAHRAGTGSLRGCGELSSSSA